MGRAIGAGVLTSTFVIGVQVLYRVYPGYFVPILLFLVVALVFYRKLDRIEVALSEERRHAEYQRRQTAGASMLVLVIVAAVLSAVGSYAAWNWLPLATVAQ